MKLPRLMLAGSGSGSGKTLLSCALLKLFQKRGLIAQPFKCGPDYIDPLYHAAVSGLPGRNLDSFFMSRYELRGWLSKAALSVDIALIEGVMGYYDGMGAGAEGSSAQLAEYSDTPVVLIINCEGRAASALAELQGFINYRPEGKLIRGVIFNRLSPGLYDALADGARSLGVLPCGYVPKDKALHMESRHLGLTLPFESEDFKSRMEALAGRLENTLDTDAILKIAECAADINEEYTVPERLFDQPLRIALAQDEAFCFYYTENKEYLHELGFELISFSPMRDEALPDCDGLILPGGYPELHAEALEKNEAMRRDMLDKIKGGLPTIAECGGYLYLHDTLTDEAGSEHSMLGLIPAVAKYKGFQRTFGYVNMKPKRDGLAGAAGSTAKGHEFHYFVSEAAAADAHIEKPDGSRSWEGCIINESLYAGFVHLWLPSAGALIKNFAKACAKYAGDRTNES